MLVTIYSSTMLSLVTEDLPCTVKWTAPFSREIGFASIRVSKNNSMFNSSHLDKKGGFVVKITVTEEVESNSRTWVGIADVPSYDSDGATINCYEMTYLFSTKYVKSNRSFFAITAGEIFRNAFLETFGGAHDNVFKLGSVGEGSPFIPFYQFTGQSFLEILNDLNSLTGQEFFITDTESNSGEFTINWGTKPASFGANSGEALVDGGNFLNVTRSGSIAQFVGEVTAIGRNGQSFTTTGTKRNLLAPEHVVRVDTESPIELKTFAEAELRNRNEIPITYQGEVPRDFYIEVNGIYNIISSKFYEDHAIIARISSLEISSSSKYQKVQLQYPSVISGKFDFTRLYQKNIKIRETLNPAEQTCFNERRNPRLSKITGVVSGASVLTDGKIKSSIQIGFERKSDKCHAGYSVRYRKTTLPSYQYLPVVKENVYTSSGEEITGSSLYALIEDLEPGATYHIGVATLAKNGLYSDYSGMLDPVSITSASTANPMVITKASHGLITNDTIRITSWSRSGLKGREFKVTVLSSSTFSIAVNGATYGGVPTTGTFLISNVQITAPGDSDAPAQVTGLVATAGIKNVSLSWNAVSDADLQHYEISSASSSGGVYTVEGYSKTTRYYDSQPVGSSGTSNTIRYYKVRAIDTSGNAGTYSSIVNATPLAISTGIGTNNITDTMVNSVSASKISGTLTGAQISSTAGLSGGQIADSAITSAKILDGTIVNNDISASAGIVGSKLANNTITATQIAPTTITSSELASNAVINSKLASGAVTPGKLTTATETGTLGYSGGGTISFASGSVTLAQGGTTKLTVDSNGYVTLNGNGGTTGILSVPTYSFTGSTKASTYDPVSFSECLAKSSFFYMHLGGSSWKVPFFS